MYHDVCINLESRIYIIYSYAYDASMNFKLQKGQVKLYGVAVLKDATTALPCGSPGSMPLSCLDGHWHGMSNGLHQHPASRHACFSHVGHVGSLVSVNASEGPGARGKSWTMSTL